MKKIRVIFMALAALALSVACGGKDRDASNDSASAGEGVSSVPAKASTVFNADSAYSFVAAQVAFGPRVAGSEAHGRCHDYLVEKLKGYGAEVTSTDTIVRRSDNRSVRVRNIEAAFNPDAARRVLLLAHYDTRSAADHDSEDANRNKPLEGANDGGSGVAVILEIARNTRALPADVGIDILLTDAEDDGTYEDDDTWCVGSQLWESKRRPTDPPFMFGILLDMVGGRDARFNREYFSERYARAVNDLVWSAARKAGHGDRFSDSVGGAVNDDHIPVLRAGIPCIDIIESNHPLTGSFNPTWHTLDDNLSNIDKSTLKAVGDVVMTTINRI